MELVVFNDEESDVIDRCQRAIKERQLTEQSQRILGTINSLVELSRAISQYPSIIKPSDYGDGSTSSNDLLEMLCEKEDFDKTLHIPTKAVLGKGFQVAKINFFQMLRFFSNPIPELRQEAIAITDFISKIVFTLMSEEVFVTIIENKSNLEEIRARAAIHLRDIWEYRLDNSLKDFAPILTSVWEARKNLQPVFGTMLGTSELMSLSAGLDQASLDFIADKSEEEEVLQALEEFLFTLTYEELLEVRAKMKERQLRCITKKDLSELIGRKLVYPVFEATDPRDMYIFYRSRKHNARFRKRAEKQGPKVTIEEAIISYLISKPEWILSE